MKYTNIFKKQSFIIVVSIILITVIIIGASYALFVSSHQGEDQTLSAGTLSATFTEDTIISANLVPLSDADALAASNNVYTFSLSNTGSLAMEYKLTLSNYLDGVNDSNMLAHKYIKIKFDNETPVYLDSLPKVDSSKTNENEIVYVIKTGIINSGVSNESHTIRIWISDTDSSGAETEESIIGKTIGFKIGLEGKATDPELSGADYVESLLASNPNTMNNDDPDGNIRYMGADPNNYVTFNNELWRIIGVFDVKTSANGQVEKRVKLIRADSLGNYSWDSSASGVNKGYGVNEWSQADIMTTLNSGAYWNRTSGTCYNGTNNSTTTCNFSSNGLTSDAKNLIENAVWNTGTVDGSTNTNSNTNAITFYTSERSSNTGKICSSGTDCNDTVERTTTWIGQVGLMYPSDYGYATSGGSTTNRQTCLNKELYNWNSVSDCYQNDWLYNSSIHQWTLTSVPYSSRSDSIFLVNPSGSVGGTGANLALGVRPVVYLKSSVKITGGEGTSTSPYQLSA